MDARTYELLNSPLDVILKGATTEQLRVIRERKNTAWRRKIDEEITARGESVEAPARPSGYSAEWTSRPGTAARFVEEDEAIHGVN